MTAPTITDIRSQLDEDLRTIRAIDARLRDARSALKERLRAYGDLVDAVETLAPENIDVKALRTSLHILANDAGKIDLTKAGRPRRKPGPPRGQVRSTRVATILDILADSEEPMTPLQVEGALTTRGMPTRRGTVIAVLRRQARIEKVSRGRYRLRHAS